MKVKYFAFQQRAIDSLRAKAAEALGSHHRTGEYQVISFTAPTGAGKTIIMAGLVESILYGSDTYEDQPDAIFVWLSDSPELNIQSRDRFNTKADKIRRDQTVIIEDESFDQEVFDDGHIYFLNTQKLGKNSNLVRNSDSRQFTIWQTIANTIRHKSDRFYFIIDEAHRGAQGSDIAKATSIMQRFIKGSPEHGITPMPVVIGMSATVERFNALVGTTSSTIQKVIVTPDEVRESGLLKETIVVKYPEEDIGHQELSVLQAAAEEWMDKWNHWYQYCEEQHYAYVNPIFLIQVLNGTNGNLTDTSLDDCLKAIEERLHMQFKEGEVVHAFGGTNSAVEANGLLIPYVEPSKISNNRKVKIVFFKESLSIGWDCPRAETMMSFRRAVDATYIAQLLGRMIRTPMGMKILVDESLNDVKLFLPFFDKDTVESVIQALMNAEGGALPANIYGESMEDPDSVVLSVRRDAVPPLPSQVSEQAQRPSPRSIGASARPAEPSNQIPLFTTDEEGNVDLNPSVPVQPTSGPATHEERQAERDPQRDIPETKSDADIQDEAVGDERLDRQAVLEAINRMAIATYGIRRAAVADYLSSLFQLAHLLVRSGIYRSCAAQVHEDIVEKVHDYIESLKATGVYERYISDVTLLKLSGQIFDVFGKKITVDAQMDIASADSDIERQFRLAESRLKNEGIGLDYRTKYFDADNPNVASVEFVLYVADETCWTKLQDYAKAKFQRLADSYRVSVSTDTREWVKDKYNTIVNNSDEVTKQLFQLPFEAVFPMDRDGRVYENHLYADSHGQARIKLNSWEEAVINAETEREDFVCWMRNPSRKSWALCVPYNMGLEVKKMFPDFLIVRKAENGSCLVDILEPHGDQYEDNLPKAQALARYAKDPTNVRVARVQMIRVTTEHGVKRLRRLDLTKLAVREKVERAMTNIELDHIFETEGE